MEYLSERDLKRRNIRDEGMKMNVTSREASVINYTQFFNLNLNSV